MARNLNMYVRNGVAYAGNAEEILSVKNVVPLEGHHLKLLFSNGETKIYDFKPMLDFPVFRSLRDINIFKRVYLDHGIVTWNGKIDIASEMLYRDSVSDDNGR